MIMYEHIKKIDNSKRMERRKLHAMSFHENELKLAKVMIDKLRVTMEFLYYLMERRKKLSFTMILLSADTPNLEHLLQTSKRNTDILVEIDKFDNVYALICQSTNYKGGEKFAEILMSHINIHSGYDVYCVAAEHKTTKYTIQEIIFKMVEKYITIKQNKQCNKVFFTKNKKKQKEDVIPHWNIS